MLHAARNLTLKMGSVSDATLLQVPVGHTRQIRVSPSGRYFNARLSDIAL
jgi:hypothetical protein